MRKSEFLKHLATLETREREQAQGLQKTRDQIQALKLVWSEVLNPPGARSDQPADAEPRAHAATDGDSSDGVEEFSVGILAKEAALRQTATFTVRDVWKVILENYPEVEKRDMDRMRPTVSGTLKRMCDDGELVLVETGRGRRPSSYTVRKEPPPPST